MTRDYDQEFGPGGPYYWPADLAIAERLLQKAPYVKSTAECLDSDFFYQYLDHLDAPFFREYEESKALELAQAAGKARQELFKEALTWPLSYLVTSATYKILSAKDEEVYITSCLGDCFFWAFLSFNEPLFDVLYAKGWKDIYGKRIRNGFKFRLSFEIGSLTVKKFIWGSDKEKPWLTCEDFASHIYSEDIVRCLDFVGIDRGLADSAVDQVFELQSLTPLYDVLSDQPLVNRGKLCIGT